MFDTLAIARRLTDTGLSDKQADALADALREAAEHDTAGIDVETLATKTDLAAEIAALEVRLYRAMLMQTTVTVGPRSACSLGHYAGSVERGVQHEPGPSHPPRPRRSCAECGKRPRALGSEWCAECYESIPAVDGTLGFSLRNAPERPHDIHVDLTGIWGDPDAVISAVGDALAEAGIDPDDFLEAAKPAADDDDELLITCRAWVHVQVPPSPPTV